MKNDPVMPDVPEGPMGTSEELLTKDVGKIGDFKAGVKSEEKVSRSGMISPARHDAEIWLTVYAASVQGLRSFKGIIPTPKAGAILAAKDASEAVTAWNLFMGDHYEPSE